MSVKINKDLCIGCGSCEALCAKVFKLNSEGKAEVVGAQDADCVKNAAASCPVQAINIK